MEYDNIMKVIADSKFLDKIYNIANSKKLRYKLFFNKRKYIRYVLSKRLKKYHKYVLNNYSDYYNNYLEVRDLCALYFDVKEYIKPISSENNNSIVTFSINKVSTTSSQEKIVCVSMVNGKEIQCNRQTFCYNKNGSKSYMELTTDFLQEHKSVSKSYKLCDIKDHVNDPGNDGNWNRMLYNYVCTTFIIAFIEPILDALIESFVNNPVDTVRKMRLYVENNKLQNGELI